MKTFIKMIITLFVLPLLAMNPALAHNSLSESVPSDQAVLTERPEAIELSLSDETYLEEIVLITVDGESILLDFEPAIAASRHFTVPLPKLDNGDYLVRWSVIGDDTHLITGEFSFMINSSSE